MRIDVREDDVDKCIKVLLVILSRLFLLCDIKEMKTIIAKIKYLEEIM